jgi:eukaryotic-like serine/threonine-protein kinase
MTERIGRFAVLRRATGGDLCVGAADGSDWLLATIHPDASTERRLRNDVGRCKRLRHRAIVPLETIAHDGACVLVVPYVPGVTLARFGRQLADEGETLADAAIWHIGGEIAGALAEAHAAAGGPIVHPRLVPEHVVLGWDGAVRLFGLGLAPLASAAREHADGPFVAPEVRRGHAVTRAANVYSVAAIVWWLLAGRMPPSEGSPARIGSLRADVPPGLAVVIDRALRAAPEERDVDCRKLAELMRNRAEGGDMELGWNMEVLRAVVPVDEVPWSAAMPPTAAMPATAPMPPTAPVSSDAPSSAAPTPRRAPQTAPSADDVGPASDAITEMRPVADVERDVARVLAARAAAASPAARPAMFPALPAGPPPSERSTTEVVPLAELERQASLDAPPAPAPPTAAVAVVEDPRTSRPTSLSAAPGLASRRRRVLLAAGLFAAFGAGVYAARLVTVSAPDGADDDTEVDAPRRSPPAAATTAAASASAPPEAPLPPGFGRLQVGAAIPAGVFVMGDYVGRVGEPLVVRCGLAFVRLGTYPERQWLSPGQSVQIACGTLTTVNVDLERPAAWPGASGKARRQWLPAKPGPVKP